jgi:hypothetical protein
MKIQNLLIITIVITIIISLACISIFPSLQDFMAYNSLWNGLRDSLVELKANTVGTLQGINQPDSKKILISIPYIQYNNDDLAQIKTFVDNGGTLLLMDDYGYGNSVLEYLNVNARFSGSSLLDPLFCYRNQWFPRVMDFSSSIVTTNVHSIVLNHATILNNIEYNQVLAWSSGSSYLDTNGNQSWDKNEPVGPLPIAAKIRSGAGTIILLSDPSILINSMIDNMQFKDDNMIFIENALEPEIKQEPVLVDTGHMVQDPMELAKIKLNEIENILSQPYVVLGIVSLLFILSSRYMLKIGGSIGRKS